MRRTPPYAVAFGPFPPPVHGAALITERTVNAFAEDMPARRVSYGSDPTVPAWRAQLLRLRRAGRAVLDVFARGCVLVYVAVPGGRAILLVLPAMLAARLRHRRVVLHHHSFAYLNSSTSALHGLVFRLASHADHITLCPRMSAMLRDRYGPKGSIAEVSNVLFARRAKRDPDRSQDGAGTLVLAHLSNLSVAKGVGTVVEAAIALARQGLDVKLRLGGPTVSPVETAILQHARSELGERLCHWGPVTQDKLDDFFARVDLFIFPSTYVNEAQPMVVFEALHRGVPCLVSGVGCLADTHGTAILAEPSSAEIVRYVMRREWSPVDPQVLAADRTRAIEALRAVLPIDPTRFAS